MSTGALNDLERATKQAYAMVAYYGMSEEVGTLSFYDSTGQSDMALTKPYSERTAQQIDAESRRLIDRAYAMAEQVLRDHAAGVEQLAELLLEREVVFTEDVERIFGKRKKDIERERREAEKAAREQAEKKSARKTAAGAQASADEKGGATKPEVKKSAAKKSAAKKSGGGAAPAKRAETANQGAAADVAAASGPARRRRTSKSGNAAGTTAADAAAKTSAAGKTAAGRSSQPRKPKTADKGDAPTPTK